MTIAAGDPWRVMRFTLVQLTAYFTILVVSTAWGLIALCIAVAAFRWVVLAASYPLLLGRLGVPLRQLARDAGPATVSLTALLSVGFAVLEAAESAGIAAAPAAVLAGIAGLAAYAWALWWVFPSLWSDLTRIATRVLRPAAARPGPSAPPAEAQAETSGHEPSRRSAPGERKPEEAPAVS